MSDAEKRDLIEKLKESFTRSPSSGASAYQWDRWFDVSTLDRDLRRKLSFHDLRRLGSHAVGAFHPAASYAEIARTGTGTNRTDTPEGRLADAFEAILTRRSHEKRLDGYTLETSQELALLARVVRR